jgi:hypothetical protein
MTSLGFNDEHGSSVTKSLHFVSMPNFINQLYLLTHATKQCLRTGNMVFLLFIVEFE